MSAGLEAAGNAYRLLFERAGEMVCLLDLEGRILAVNRAGEQLTGYPAAELVGRLAIDLVTPEMRDQAVHQFQERLRDPRERPPDETMLLTRDNRRVPIEVRSTRFELDGQPVGVLGLVADRTAQEDARQAALRLTEERKQSEAELQDAETRFRSFFDLAPIGEAIVAIDGRYLEVNDALCEAVGYAKDELIAATFADLTHPDDLAADLELIRQTLAGERRSFQVEKRYLHKLGGVVWVLLSVSLVRTAEGDPSYFIRQIQDISERKRAQEAVAISEASFAEAQHIARVGSWESDLTTGAIVISQELARLFELDPAGVEVTLDQLLERMHPDDRALIVDANTDAVDKEEASNLEYRIVLAGGEVRWIHARGEAVWAGGKVVGRRGTSQDITERKLAEADRDRLSEQFHQAQKLEAVGRLAGGIAHDFNNMLTAIKGYSALLLDDLEPGTPAYDEAVQIHRTAEQASALPAQLLSFSRSQPLEPQLIDLNELVVSATGLLEHLVSEAIEVAVDSAAEPILVYVDSARVETALVNLALNARDAMPSGGKLTISTGAAVLGDEAAAQQQVAAGRYAVVSVSDDGEGMAPETAARAFEPFFTTKPRGQGSGLGLASVYGTVRQSGGFVSVESRPGHGTTVRLHLPVASGHATVDATPRAHDVQSEPEAPGRASAGSVVLVVEDEDVVRELVVRILRRDGHVVHAAASGSEALGLLDRLGRPVDVLLTDMVMPGMSGRDLAERVLRRRPETPVVFMSGYTEDAPTLDGGRQHTAFLTKPFSTTALRAALRRAEEQTGATAVSSDGISCLIVDDHPSVLDAVSRYLEAAGIRVIGRAARADVALERIRVERPATALVDVAIEPFDGVELARRAAVISPETSIVLYTGSRDPELLRRSLDSGIRGFVVKDTQLSDLATALVAVANGEHHIDPALAADMMAAPPAQTLPPLTNREQDVLRLIATGSTNERAAAELGISPETVQSHVKNAMHKLDADTRTQAVATALRHSLIP